MNYSKILKELLGKLPKTDNAFEKIERDITFFSLIEECEDDAGTFCQISRKPAIHDVPWETTGRYNEDMLRAKFEYRGNRPDVFIFTDEETSIIIMECKIPETINIPPFCSGGCLCSLEEEFEFWTAAGGKTLVNGQAWSNEACGTDSRGCREKAVKVHSGTVLITKRSWGSFPDRSFDKREYISGSYTKYLYEILDEERVKR